MKNIKELRQQKADLVNEGKALVAKGELSAEDRARHKAVLEKLKSVNADIETVQAEIDAELQQVQDAGTERRLFVAQRKPGAAGRRYRELFAAHPRREDPAGGFKNFHDFMSVVHSGLNDPRLTTKFSAALSGHGEKFPSEGGFLVPEQFSAEMLDSALESEVVRPRARIYSMTSLTRKIAGWDGLDNSAGAPFGGFDLSWLDEGATGTTKKGKTRLIQLVANRCAIFTTSSDELIVDGFTFEEMLSEALVQAVAWGLDSAFFTGNGVGKPKGVLSDAALISVAKETSQAADTIMYENVGKMLARLHPRSFNDSVWVANPTCIPELLLLKNVVKNVAGTENVGGSAVPVLSTEGGEFRLLTRPMLFTEKLPVLGEQGDLILADFSQYAVGLRQEVSIERSQHIGWFEGEVAFRAVIRVDGQGRWSKPYTPLNGLSQSWIVALDARA